LVIQVGGSDVLACGSLVNGMIGWGSLYWLQVMKDNSAGRARMRSALALCALGVYLSIDWVCSVHCLRNLSVYCSNLADVSDDWSYSMNESFLHGSGSLDLEFSLYSFLVRLSCVPLVSPCVFARSSTGALAPQAGRPGLESTPQVCSNTPPRCWSGSDEHRILGFFPFIARVYMLVVLEFVGVPLALLGCRPR
jgi:hypothetical protein